MILKIIFIFFLPFFCLAEFPYFQRSPEGLLMGDAYTAVADDENTLFYNPAALGRHKGVSISLLNFKTEVTDSLERNVKKLEFGIKDRYKNWPKSAEGIAQRILGIPLHTLTGAVPSIKMQHFGLNFAAGSRLTMILENATHPNLNLNYRLDRGLIMGHAFTFEKGKNRTSLGLALKQIERSGLQGRFDLFGPQLIKISENSKDYKKLRSELGYSEGKGWGVDIGLEYVIKRSDRQWIFGASFLDVGEIHFKKIKGEGKIPDQESSLNFGVSYSKKSLLLDYIIDLDYKNAIDPVGSKKSKFSLGTRLKFPIITAYFGWSGGYRSYGIALDIFMLQILAGFYGVETGYDYKEREGERAIVFIRLLGGHFDF